METYHFWSSTQLPNNCYLVFVKAVQIRKETQVLQPLKMCIFHQIFLAYFYTKSQHIFYFYT